MRALCYHAKQDIRCDTVPDPQIEHPRDAIIRVTPCAICGSDPHLYNGFVSGMMDGGDASRETPWTSQPWLQLSAATTGGREMPPLPPTPFSALPYSTSCAPRH